MSDGQREQTKKTLLPNKDRGWNWAFHVGRHRKNANQPSRKRRLATEEDPKRILNQKIGMATSRNEGRRMQMGLQNQIWCRRRLTEMQSQVSCQRVSSKIWRRRRLPRGLCTSSETCFNKDSSSKKDGCETSGCKDCPLHRNIKEDIHVAQPPGSEQAKDRHYKRASMDWDKLQGAGIRNFMRC